MPKISDLPTDTAPASTDLIPFVDVDAARTESVTVANLAASAAFSGQYLSQVDAEATYAPIYPYRLWLPGTTGNYVSTPDAADLDLAGDMEIVFKVSAPDWTPSTARIVAARRTSGGGLAWQLGLGTDGKLTLSLRTGGVDYYSDSTSAALSALVDGSTYWLRVRRTSASGAVAYAYAANQTAEPSTWTTVATTGTQTAGVIDAGAQPLEIGSNLAGTGSTPWIGTFDRFILRSGFGGTTVADYDSSIPAVRYYGADGKVYTVNGTGSAWAIA